MKGDPSDNGLFPVQPSPSNRLKNIKKILVANRGEIACRILRTCRRMGVQSVAVYPPGEPKGLYVEMADEARPLRPSETPAQGFLDIDAQVSIALETGADAIHPGYGFLSENPGLAQACTEAGIAFIGPPPRVTRSMANKRQAREMLKALGVPVLPGTSGPVDGIGDVQRRADDIGYPVMVKASEGGGGIGLGIVTGPEQLERALQHAESSSRRAFGSDDLYLEKYIPDSRHIEVQVLGDQHGNLVHLFERDCSVQRRHQKIIEETPAPGFSIDQRAAITEAAMTAARGIGYQNAGTFEFLLDPEGGFYFLEANTRLQVEHGITEMTTDIDLVEQQIRVADGEPLEICQEDVNPQGHAIEVRICAEDPTTFLPSPGPVTEWSVPDETGVRVDAGVQKGDEVTWHFDPLIAKVMAHADDRDAAIDRMLSALERTRIEGIKTNIPFLIKALDSAPFRGGGHTTALAAKITSAPA